jgi:hypothetical protein
MIKELILKIEKFAHLAPGWDSYNGEAISRETIEAAKKVAPMLGSITAEYWSVFPCGDGSVQFETATTTLKVFATEVEG